MRVLILGNAAGLGGAQTAFREFAEFLLREGTEVAVLAIGGEQTALPSHSGRGFANRIPESGTGLPGQLKKAVCTSRAAWLGRSFRPDIFVSVGFARTANLVARSLRSSCFKIAQDFIFGRSAQDPLLTASAHAFNAIAVQAPSMMTALRHHGFNTRPVNWLPCFPERPASRCSRQAADLTAGVRLAYFGRLAANKGLDLMLEALSGSDFAVPVNLDVWGTGTEVEPLRARCSELGLTQRVRFLGRYPAGESGARLMCEYHAMVLPSTGCEGLPLILLEAMAYGLPFLATDVGAIRDCCEGNTDSILVPPNRDDLRCGIHEMVRRLIARDFEPERLQAYYRSHFSYGIMAERWRQCLRGPEAFFNAGH